MTDIPGSGISPIYFLLLPLIPFPFALQPLLFTLYGYTSDGNAALWAFT
ncbi:hypothetical protein PN499_02775 [Kamptonema animale CS-326]|nr:hypothetical protein [Kamptonema animale]MDB9510132.1 hypothetical protein [Kamptonema animale CS-326]